MSDISSAADLRRFVTPKQLVEIPRYGWLSLSSLRHLIFQAQPRINSKGEALPTNGLERAIIKVGRKILIDCVEFDAWIEDQRITNPNSSYKKN